MRKNKTKRKTKEKRNGSRDKKREKCQRTPPLGGEVKAETSSLGFFRELDILKSVPSYL